MAGPTATNPALVKTFWDAALSWEVAARSVSSHGPQAIALAVLPLDGFTATHGICLPLHPAPGYRCSVYGQARHEDGPRGVTVLSSP